MREIYSDDDMTVFESGEDLYVKLGNQTKKLTRQEAQEIAEALASWDIEKQVESGELDGERESSAPVSTKPFTYTIPEDGVYVVDGYKTTLHAGVLLESNNPFVVERSEA